MPSRTLTLFNLYYIFSVLQCYLIAVLFIIIISRMSNFNSFYQDLYRILLKITSFLRTSAKPPPPSPTSAFDKPPQPLRTAPYLLEAHTLLTTLSFDSNNYKNEIKCLLVVEQWKFLAYVRRMSAAVFDACPPFVSRPFAICPPYIRHMSAVYSPYVRHT